MQQVIPEFFEDINEALREAVRYLGGHKRVGGRLRPEMAPEQAGNWVRDCLAPDRREKFSPEQTVLVLRMSRDAGYHGAMNYLAMSAGYEAKPADAEEQAAELQRKFVEAVDNLQKIQQQLQATSRMRAVA